MRASLARLGNNGGDNYKPSRSLRYADQQIHSRTRSNFLRAAPAIGKHLQGATDWGIWMSRTGEGHANLNNRAPTKLAIECIE